MKKVFAQVPGLMMLEIYFACFQHVGYYRLHHERSKLFLRKYD